MPKTARIAEISAKVTGDYFLCSPCIQLRVTDRSYPTVIGRFLAGAGHSLHWLGGRPQGGAGIRNEFSAGTWYDLWPRHTHTHTHTTQYNSFNR